MNNPTVPATPQTIVSRDEAKALGRSRYFTGKKCRRQHIAERVTKTGHCILCRRKRQRAYRNHLQETNPNALRAQRRRSRGLPIPTRDEPANCESCGRYSPLVLDHNHATGAFRGWLCRQCNVAIGLLGDHSANVRRAAIYLVRAGS